MNGGPDWRVEDVDELFYNDRLSPDFVSVSDHPARIDQAAMDLCYGVVIGETSERSEYGSRPPRGGTITKVDFGRATGGYYKRGLKEIASDRSDLQENAERYEDRHLGSLALRLNEVRYELSKFQGVGDEEAIENLDRVLEAIVEKLRTRSIRAADAGVVGQSLRNPETVAEAVQQMLSDPSIKLYADELVELFEDSPGGENLLRVLDAPEMVTPLWDHQREALENWVSSGRHGYVDMATATGKTVLGLAAIAAEYGALHPVDETELEVDVYGSNSTMDDRANLLVVAGQEVILEQWRSEFDEHFDIPRDRTSVEEGADTRRIRLRWGTIDFVTAQELLNTDPLVRYDLVVLDEAHRYTRGSQSGQGWGKVIEALTQNSEALLAMSGSVDHGWSGDEAAKNALETNLEKVMEFSIDEAREAGVVADFSWEVRYTQAAGTDAQEDLVTETETLRRAYDDELHQFDLSKVDERLAETEETTFETLTDLRAFGQSSDGSSLAGDSEHFDELVTAAFARRPHRWQLSPAEDEIATLVTEHVPEDNVVVLVQSYSQSDVVADRIAELVGEELVVVPDSGGEEQFDKVTQFNEEEYRVIVGPGDVLGRGVDMPEADTAINLAKGGVNASLIQRIGRVLRNPDGDKDATFYHVVSQPTHDEAYLYGEDGRRHLKRAAEFKSFGSRMREEPNFTAGSDNLQPWLAELETSGEAATTADHRSLSEIVDDDVAREHLEELLYDISESREETSVLLSGWNGGTIDRSTEPGKDRSRADSIIHTQDDSDASKDTPDGVDDLDMPDELSDSGGSVAEEAEDEAREAQRAPSEGGRDEADQMEVDSSKVTDSSEDEDSYESGADTLFGEPSKGGGTPDDEAIDGREEDEIAGEVDEDSTGTAESTPEDETSCSEFGSDSRDSSVSEDEHQTQDGLSGEGTQPVDEPDLSTAAEEETGVQEDGEEVQTPDVTDSNSGPDVDRGEPPDSGLRDTASGQTRQDSETTWDDFDSARRSKESSGGTLERILEFVRRLFE